MNDPIINIMRVIKNYNTALIRAIILSALSLNGLIFTTQMINMIYNNNEMIHYINDQSTSNIYVITNTIDFMQNKG